MSIGSVSNPTTGLPVASAASVQDAMAASAAQNGAAAGLDASSAADGADRFLKLLVAQMKNQDPLNPLDNAQVTSQMAQISTVQGIEKLNTSMQKWLTQSSAVQQLDGAALIGKRVLVEGSGLELAGGTSRTAPARGGYELDASAAQVRIEVLDAAGKVVSTTERAGAAAGVHTFDWDGRDASGKALADGRYTLRVTAGEAGALKPVSTLTAGTVTAIVSSSEGARIELGAAGQRAVNDVKGIL